MGRMVLKALFSAIAKQSRKLNARTVITGLMRNRTTSAMPENAISIAVFQGAGESANRLKAAPVFSVCVSRKKPGMIWMCE